MAKWQDYRFVRRGLHHSAVGNIKIREKVWSPQLRNQRDIVVYLPPSYDLSEKHYPVLYMHDGQNLFDQATSFSGEWHVDETMERLYWEGFEAIVVGISNIGGQRLAEYGPFADTYHGPGRGDRYLDFIEQTLIPLINSDFRTLLGRKHTGIIGSSMGGLISLYAFFRPDSPFGLAGIMSPSIWYAGSAILEYVRQAEAQPGRIYLDAGTREYGGITEEDAKRRSRTYYARVRRLKRILIHKGYRPFHDLLHVEEKWAGHNEPAWARRLPDALRFLLEETRAKAAVVDL